MKRAVKRFCSDTSGATAIEYGLIVTMIALVIIGGLTALSGANNNKYNAITAAVSGAM